MKRQFGLILCVKAECVCADGHQRRGHLTVLGVLLPSDLGCFFFQKQKMLIVKGGLTHQPCNGSCVVGFCPMTPLVSNLDPLTATLCVSLLHP